jgi:hypothetical protein
MSRSDKKDGELEKGVVATDVCVMETKNQNIIICIPIGHKKQKPASLLPGAYGNT